MKLSMGLTLRVWWARIFPATRPRTLQAVGQYLIRRGRGCYRVPRGTAPEFVSQQHDLVDWGSFTDAQLNTWIIDFLAVGRTAAAICQFKKGTKV